MDTPKPKRESPRSIRLPLPEWEKLKALGTKWLIKKIRGAKLPPNP